jgi:hypothetical protein
MYFFALLSAQKFQFNLIHVTIGNNNRLSTEWLITIISYIILFQFTLNVMSGSYTDKSCNIKESGSESEIVLRLFSGTRGDGSIQFYFFQFLQILIDQIGVIYQGASQISINKNIINYIDDESYNEKMNLAYGYRLGSWYGKIISCF